MEEMQFLVWRAVAQNLEFKLLEPDTGSLVLGYGEDGYNGGGGAAWSENV